MSNHNPKPAQDPLPFFSWQQAREKREQQLAEVRRRRRVIYELMRKMQPRYPMAASHSLSLTPCTTRDIIALLMSLSTTPLATVVTRKGQVTIPSPIREALGIKRGDTIAFQLEGHGAKLTPVSSTLAEGYQSIPALKQPLSEEEIEAIVRDDRADAYKKKSL